MGSCQWQVLFKHVDHLLLCEKSTFTSYFHDQKQHSGSLNLFKIRHKFRHKSSHRTPLAMDFGVEFTCLGCLDGDSFFKGAASLNVDISDSSVNLIKFRHKGHQWMDSSLCQAQVKHVTPLLRFVKEQIVHSWEPLWHYCKCFPT